MHITPGNGINAAEEAYVYSIIIIIIIITITP
jgi:hypothetical protein